MYQRNEGELQIPRLRSEAVTFSIFSCFLHIQLAVFQALSSPQQSRHPERSASQIYRKQGFMARSRRTPAMHVGRGSCELSGRKLHRKIKKSQPLSGAPHRLSSDTPLVRGVEGPRGCLSYSCRSELFNHRGPHLACPPRSFPGRDKNW
jgi:hypothetical protein